MAVYKDDVWCFYLFLSHSTSTFLTRSRPKTSPNTPSPPKKKKKNQTAKLTLHHTIQSFDNPEEKAF